MFLEQPLDRSSNLLNQIAQIVITYHNESRKTFDRRDLPLQGCE